MLRWTSKIGRAVLAFAVCGIWTSRLWVSAGDIVALATPIISFTYVGDQIPLRVVGTFVGGSEIDVAESTRTKYTSDAPGIAAVRADGLVTATGMGSARITVANGGVTAVLPVVVRKRMPPGDAGKRSTEDRTNHRALVIALRVLVMVFGFRPL